MSIVTFQFCPHSLHDLADIKYLIRAVFLLRTSEFSAFRFCVLHVVKFILDNKVIFEFLHFLGRNYYCFDA
jgi:hypothetical protein